MQLVWIGIWVDLEVVEVESEEGNGINDKRKLKNQIFPFAWLCEMDQKVELCCKQRRIAKLISHDHTKILHNHALISHSHVKWSRRLQLLLLNSWFHTTMQNRLSSFEMTILLLNSRLLDEEASKRPLKWCCPLDLNL